MAGRRTRSASAVARRGSRVRARRSRWSSRRRCARWSPTIGPRRARRGRRCTIAARSRSSAARQRVPLVIVLASSGADVEGGIGALHGWGLAARAARRCSGIVPVLVAVTGPAVSGPALLLGLADLVVMTEDAYAFVSGPHMVQAFTGVPVTTSARWSRRAWPCHRCGQPARRVGRRRLGCARRPRGPACRPTPTSSRRGSTATIRPTEPHPRRARCSRRRRPGATTCGTWCGRSSTTASCWSCAPVCGQPRHRASRPSTADRSASWPINR